MIDAETMSGILERLDDSSQTGVRYRELAMALLSGLDHYDWSGIYRLEGDELVLDAYVGEATDHTRIAVGKGVCGTAVAENANQVVSDVRTLGNYLACSVKTRAEIVVLIRKGETVLGQIDIDGHVIGAFDVSDEKFLEEIASRIAARWDD